MEEYVKTGTLDGSVHLIKNKKRDDFFLFSKTPILTGRTLVFVKKGQEFPFNSIQDLYGKNVGVLLGYKVMGNAFEQAAQDSRIAVEEVSNHQQNLKKLMAGRIDCLIGTENLTWHHAHQLEVAKTITALPNVLNIISVYFAIGKNSKHITDPEIFMEAMNASLDSLISDGTYETLQKKYALIPFE